jgi:hypothetical protein
MNNALVSQNKNNLGLAAQWQYQAGGVGRDYRKRPTTPYCNDLRDRLI